VRGDGVFVATRPILIAHHARRLATSGGLFELSNNTPDGVGLWGLQIVSIVIAVGFRLPFIQPFHNERLYPN
jgi:hypothetical protein